MAWHKNVVTVPGEVIYEILVGSDAQNAGFGIAAAEIDQSKQHYHEITHEMYVLLEGVLRITWQWKGQQEINAVCLSNWGESFKISPGMLHRARSIGPKAAKVLVISSPPWTKEDHHLA